MTIPLQGFYVFNRPAMKPNIYGSAAGGLATYISYGRNINATIIPDTPPMLIAMRLENIHMAGLPLHCILLNRYLNGQGQYKKSLVSMLIKYLEDLQLQYPTNDLILTGDFNIRGLGAKSKLS